MPFALVLVMLSLLHNLMAAAGWNVNNIDVTDGQDEARTVFCKGETVKLTVTDTCSSTAKRSYSWSPGGSTNNPLILTNLNAGNYTSTVTVTIGGDSSQASAGFTVVKVDSISTNSDFSATAYPIYVGSNTTIKFYAKPSPVGQWPAGKPAWGGVASGSGSDQVTVTFDAVGTNYVTAECGNTVTATVVVIKVESVLPNNIEREIDDGDDNPDTRTFVVNMTTTPGDLVTVTATPAPNIAEANLPASWTLDGGNGSGKLVRTIDRTQASKTVLHCSCGNEKITTVYVVHCTYSGFSDGAVPGHAWWHLEIEPDSAKAGAIENITAGLSILVDTDGGFFPIYPGALHTNGWVNIGSQGHSATAHHDWNITFQNLMSGLTDLSSWVLDPGMYDWDTRNCVYGSLRIGGDSGVTMPSFSYPDFFTPTQFATWLNAQ